MKAFIIQFPYGVAAFDDKNSLVEKVLFPRKPQAAARSLLKTEAGQMSDDVFSLISLLKNVGYDTFVFEKANLADEIQRKMAVTVEVAKPSEAEALRALMNTVALESGFVKDDQELSLWNRNVSMELAKLRIKGATEKRDLIVAQGIQTLDDLDRTVNLFMGRLREWYGVYFPELDRLIEKHETYSRLVTNLGDRESFTIDGLEKENIPKERAQIVAKAAEASMGADIAQRDLEQIQELAKNVSEFYELRKNMENYVDRTMEEMAPNVRAVAGALLGARLIAIAGSLQILAMRPASTIQVLGAEKALFRSLKTGARPPKHGLIFQHTLLHDAKRWQRGKIARVIAGKLAIAARADAFGGHFIGDDLKADINKRLEEIREKYKEPPAPKEAKPRTEGFERREPGPPRRDQGGFRGGGQGGGFRDRDRGRRPPRHGGGGRDRGDRRGAVVAVVVAAGKTGDQKDVHLKVKPHPKFKEIYQVMLEDGAQRLATRNLTPGLRVYGERLFKFKYVEYRVWDAFRSKLAGAILKGLQNVPIEPGFNVLYLGAASGTTPSHVSDIVGDSGHVYCVEFAQRSLRDLVNNVAAYRTNISPLLEDARMPERYAMFISGKVDTIYCDVAQPEQAKLLADNADVFLKPSGWVMLACKSQSIDVTMDPNDVYRQEANILRKRGFDVKEVVDLEPFDKAHAMIVAQKS